MKQPHDMLIEGNHEKLYPEKSSGNIRLNQLSVVWFFYLVNQWPRRTRWKTNSIFLDFRQFFFGELAKVLVDG